MIPHHMTRYVVTELGKSLCAALGVLTFLLIAVGLVQEAVRQGLGPGPIVRLIPYTALNALVFSVPGATLFAVCSVFGRMSAANEIVAIKALGISPFVVMRPAFVLSALLSTGTVWLSDVAFTWGYEGIQQVIWESVEEIAYGILRTQHRYTNSFFTISVADVEGRRLIQPTIHVQQSSGDAITMMAREASISVDPRTRTLHVSLTDGTIEGGKDLTLTFSDTIEHSISLGDADGSGTWSASPSHIALADMAESKRRQQQDNQRLENRLACLALLQYATGDFQSLENADWQRDLAELQSGRQRLARLATEPYRRWASGFSCLAFALIGVPLAIRWRHADLMTTFFACYLPILLAYYPLFAIGLDRAKSGAWPPFAVWLGNVGCVVAGLWAMRGVYRH